MTPRSSGFLWRQASGLVNRDSFGPWKSPEDREKPEGCMRNPHSFWKSCLGWALSPGSLTGTKGPLTGAPAQCTSSLSRGHPPGALTCQRLSELGAALPRRAAQHVDERLGEDRGQSASMNGGCGEPFHPGLSSTILCCFSRGLSGTQLTGRAQVLHLFLQQHGQAVGPTWGARAPRDT